MMANVGSLLKPWADWSPTNWLELHPPKSPPLPWPQAMNSSTHFFVYYGPGPNEILHSDTLEYAMDKFHLLTSPKVRNMISSFRKNNKGGGKIDHFLDMKGCAKMEYIHDRVFMGQGLTKIYLFKMLVDATRVRPPKFLYHVRLGQNREIMDNYRMSYL